MIEESYVSFDTAKLLKEVGFDCNCHKWYEKKDDKVLEWEADAACNWNMNKNDFSRPTQALAARWLREVHHYAVCVWFSKDHEKWFYAHGNMDDIVFDTDYCISEYIYDSYEEALEAGLQEAIKLIKK